MPDKKAEELPKQESKKTEGGFRVHGKEEEKNQQEMIENTDHSRTANENVEAGGHPAGTVPGGTT